MRRALVTFLQQRTDPQPHQRAEITCLAMPRFMPGPNALPRNAEPCRASIPGTPTSGGVGKLGLEAPKQPAALRAVIAEVDPGPRDLHSPLIADRGAREARR